MKTHLLLILLMPLLPLTACADRKWVTYVDDPNDLLVQITTAVVHTIVEGDVPAVNDAVANLPPDTQMLAQTAFAALKKAIESAQSHDVTELAPEKRLEVAKVVTELAQASDLLHCAIHQEDSSAASDPNAPTVRAMPTDDAASGERTPLQVQTSPLLLPNLRN